ncbi:MAG: hypothetical protein ACE5G8_13415 [Anaerolineae bacterium]
MPKITCRLMSHSISIHIQQIYTGFFMLYKRGLIDLTQTILKENSVDTTKPQHLRNARHAHLRVILNDDLKLHYDAHDSWEIDEEYLSQADFYFKRSFAPSRLENLGQRGAKIHPLGLNYLVYPDSLDKYALGRSRIPASAKERLRALAHSFSFFDSFRFTPRVRLMESLPDDNSPPKILFMVKAYDPYNHPDRLEEKVEERVHTNQTKADVIRLLKDVSQL